jgi:tetratricopeptide (TPR) repeat protein
MAGTLNNLGEVTRLQGDYSTAQRHYQEALDIAKEIDSQRLVAITYCNLGHTNVTLGDNRAAMHCYHKAIRITMIIEAIPIALESLAGLAQVTARTGQAERALEFLGLARHHPALMSDTKPIIESILADLRAKLPSDVVEAALKRGNTLELDTVVAEILGDTAK